MKIKFMKTHKDATIPKRGKPGDAGYDLTAVHTKAESIHISPDFSGSMHTYKVAGTKITIDTGIAVEIPEGYVGYLFPRGSIFNYDVEFANSVGVIDSNFRGSIKVVLNSFLTQYDLEIKGTTYKVGDKIAQLIVMPIPDLEFEEVKELSETCRNGKMLGSSGK